ncbi:MAG TPA: hypothetical protein VMT03_02425 [Polyangia bacterium]|nr:hypothetical protein [Polyangia bacterium]
MKGRPDEPSPELQPLLDREREIEPLPAAVRARAMARARAAVVAGLPAKELAARGRPPWPRWAVAAALLLTLSAAAAAAVHQWRARLELRRASSQPVRTALLAPPAAPAPKPPAVSVEEAPAQPVAPARPSEDTASAELRLLRQARDAVARQDYAAALPPLAEHARRFKNGRLTEEREALRIKALAGLGRTDEARRAAQGFQNRFPRSVLLPAVQRMTK